MKFLGTLAFGFSTIAAMIAALLAFGFQFRVESPISPQQMVKEQQLSQCTAALSLAEQQAADAQGKAQGLEARLRDATLIASQTAAQLSAEVTQRAQLASERTALAGTSTSVATGIGFGLLMFPLGFLLGRRRGGGVPVLTATLQEPLVVEAPRAEPVAALPVYDNRYAGRVQGRPSPVR